MYKSSTPTMERLKYKYESELASKINELFKQTHIPCQDLKEIGEKTYQMIHQELTESDLINKYTRFKKERELRLKPRPDEFRYVTNPKTNNGDRCTAKLEFSLNAPKDIDYIRLNDPAYEQVAIFISSNTPPKFEKKHIQQEVQIYAMNPHINEIKIENLLETFLYNLILNKHNYKQKTTTQKKIIKHSTRSIE